MESNLEKIAKELGLEVEHSGPVSPKGHIRIYGPLAEVLRAWAMAGYDRELSWDGEKTKTWIFAVDGEYAGLCDTVKNEDFGYSYTSCI
jgi:hypothetical protein